MLPTAPSAPRRPRPGGISAPPAPRPCPTWPTAGSAAGGAAASGLAVQDRGGRPPPPGADATTVAARTEAEPRRPPSFYAVPAREPRCRVKLYWLDRAPSRLDGRNGGRIVEGEHHRHRTEWPPESCPRLIRGVGLVNAGPPHIDLVNGETGHRVREFHGGCAVRF